MRKIDLHISDHDLAQKVIPAERFTHMIQASDYLKDGKRALDEEKKTIENLAGITQQNAYTEGYEAGFTQGYGELSRLIDALKTSDEQFKANMASLVKSCLEKILYQLPDKALMEKVFNELFKKHSDARKLSVSAHPKHAGTIDSIINKINLDKTSISFIPDEDMSEGDCLLYTPVSIVDASIRTQISVLCQAIEKGA